MSKKGGTIVTEGYITTEKAAELTGYTVRYIRQLARQGIIEAEKITPRAWLIGRASLEEYAAQMVNIGDKRHDPRRNPQWIESKRKEKATANDHD